MTYSLNQIPFFQELSESKLFINPLMSIYWAFDLRKVMKKITYYEEVKDTYSMPELRGKLARYRNNLPDLRRKKNLPL